MSATVPPRALQQRHDALAHANEIRLGRARLKRDIKDGRRTVVQVLVSPPVCAENMKVWELLASQSWWGNAKVARVMARAEISPRRTVGGLTTRQRILLVDLLQRRRER